MDSYISFMASSIEACGEMILSFIFSNIGKRLYEFRSYGNSAHFLEGFFKCVADEVHLFGSQRGIHGKGDLVVGDILCLR